MNKIFFVFVLLIFNSQEIISINENKIIFINNTKDNNTGKLQPLLVTWDISGDHHFQIEVSHHHQEAIPPQGATSFWISSLSHPNIKSYRINITPHSKKYTISCTGDKECLRFNIAR